jgi:hypothetical protein
MQFSIRNAIFGLLAFGLLSGPTQALPHTSSDAAISLPSASLQATTPSNDTSSGDATTTGVAKRTKPPLVFSLQPGLEWTWAGVIKEPQGAGWTTNTAKEYAYEAWQQTQQERSHVTMVAALWVRGKGIYLGSIPHAYNPDEKEDVETTFEAICSNTAPLLYDKIGCREVAPRAARYHAEDMAMMTYERTEKPSGSYPQQSPRSYMAVYGQYPGGSRPAFVKPCGALDPKNAKIQPSCAEVLDDFIISY